MLQINKQSLFLFWAICFLPIESVLGQWTTQNINLKPGWNGVYLTVDPSYTDISSLPDFDSNITEIWLWKPIVKSDQFIKDPDVPTLTKSRWVRWSKALGASSNLQRLVGNASYLVKLGNIQEDGSWDVAGNVKWNIKGKPVPPNYNWTSTGLNFIGMHVQDRNVVTFEQYFPSSILNGEPPAEFFTYRGGDLVNDGINKNPALVQKKRTTSINRGEAFWMRIGTEFNSYFGPFELVLQNINGIEMGETRERYRIILKNNLNEPLNVTMTLIDSEDAPAGEDNIGKDIKVLVRGEPNVVDLTYGYTSMEKNKAISYALKSIGGFGAASSQEIILGVDRANSSGDPGDKIGGILEFVDSKSLMKIQVPISAIIPSNEGLWIGDVKVGSVRHDITFFRKKNEDEVEVDENGKAISEGINDTYGEVAENYPLRFIIHNSAGDDDGEAETKVFQRIFYGLRNGAEVDNDIVLTNDQRALEYKQLGSARRVASSNLPFDPENKGWKCTGDFNIGKSFDVTIGQVYNDRLSNPFLHAYHPDHDNLDPKFENELIRGKESWGIVRNIKFRVDSPKKDFDNLVSVGRRYTGEYHEEVTILGSGKEKKTYYAKGLFNLNRISQINTITAYVPGAEPQEEVPDVPDEEEVESDGEPTGEDDRIDGGDGGDGGE